MKKSFMSNIMNFVDSNVRQRIDRVAHNNNEFFSDDLLTLERHFEDIRQVCVEAERRISAILQSIQSTPSLGAYTQNVQVGFNNLSQNIAHVASGSGSTVQPQALPNQPATGGCVGNTNSNLKCIQQSTNKNSNNLVTGRGEYSSSSSSITTTTTTTATSKLSTSEQTATRTHPNHRLNNDDGVSDITNGSHLVSNSPIDLIDPAQQLTNDIQHRHKKLPIVGFLKFLVKSCHKLKPDSLLATTLTHCSQLQMQLTKLYLAYEQTIELQCLKPVQHMLEIDIPNVVKLRKLFIKSHNDLESLKAKYNGVSQKQLHQQQHQQQQQQTGNSYTIAQSSAQQSNINKLDQLKKDMDDAVTRFEQARDTYEAELYSFVCRESEIVDLLRSLYKYQAEYHQQVIDAIQGSLPTLDNILVYTPRKVVFGVQLDEHLRCTGRLVSPVIELCTHLLYCQGLKEEGLFRIPGSSVKIKKLKNAINAWFVTLASRQELESDQQRQSGHSIIVALYHLFKNILGHGQQSASIDLQVLLPTSTVSSGVSGGGDESTVTKSSLSNCNSNQTPPPPPQATTTTTTKHDDQLTFDLHSIAGLLKLYLRELPEPLISHSLYDQWLAAASMNTNEEKLNALSCVIEQMPKANYNNLRHLIRFLHLLTCHQEHNKMSSSNLAITMAPSLIWSKPASVVVGPVAAAAKQTPTDAASSLSSSSHSALTDGCDVAHTDETNNTAMMNLHMSSVGMSASLHALVLEALINYAESLFPGQVDFTLATFKELTSSKYASQCEQATSCSSLVSKNRERSVKSTSPTGISTASSSSSSFSSTASASTCSSARPKPTHSRKSGSMDGLLNHGELGADPPAQTRTTITTTPTTTGRSMNKGSSASTRPMSVHLQSREFCPTSTTTTTKNSHQQQPPPVPPVPLVRPHGRYNAPDQQQQLSSSGRSNLKAPAPRAPQQPPSVSLSTRKQADNDQVTADTTSENQKPRAASLRGTGSISLAPNAAPQSGPSTGGGGGLSNLNSVRRPTVPPPDRPPMANSMASREPSRASPDMATDHSNRTTTTSKTASIRLEGDSQSSRSVTSGGGGGVGVGVGVGGQADEIDISASRPDSAVVWPDTNSGDDDDSSFDEANHDGIQPNQHDNQSLGHSSSIDCGLTAPSGADATPTDSRSLAHSTAVVDSPSDDTTTTTGAFNHPPPKSAKQQQTTDGGAGDKNHTACDESSSRRPPVKPPRTTSPKITQSTPL